MAAARAARGAALFLAVALASCGAPSDEPPPPKDALALDDAVDHLTVALFARAKPALPTGGRRVLVIDPLIDRATGNQSTATRSMEDRISKLVRARYNSIEPQPFTTDTLSSQPLILVGSITPVAAPGVIPPTTTPTQTYRIWAALADLRTGRVLSHETAWVRADEVDMTPTPFFRDSPSWLADTSQAAYIRTCASNPGDPIDHEYLDGLYVSANVADGIKSYEAGRYNQALEFYTRAQQSPAGQQLRVFNGLYLTNAALERPQEAEAAFGDVVDYGLSRGKIAVKFLFQANSTRFWADRAVTGPYPMFLRQIASHTANRAACLRLVGHATATGSTRANDALSLSRAGAVRGELVRRQPALTQRTDAEGRGSREPLVGSARDDATDVLDRRVELETRPCPEDSL